MDSMGVEQNMASNIMIVMGVAETFSRFGSSLVGDQFKGWVLPIYTGLAIGLTITNVLGYFSTNVVHIIIYGIGQWSFYSFYLFVPFLARGM